MLDVMNAIKRKRTDSTITDSANGAGHDDVDTATIDLAHLRRMFDDTGMLQHAAYSTPNRSHGYCLDDNARAAQFLCRYRERTGDASVDRMIGTTLAFMQHAYNESEGRFRNFMGYDRAWLEEIGSEDAHGRALFALGTLAAMAPLPAERELAADLFARAAKGTNDFTSPRSWASIILAMDEISTLPALFERHRPLLERNADRLAKIFADRDNRADACEWPWPEETVTYANAQLPHALMVAGRLLDRPTVIRTGLDVLEWLFTCQTGYGGRLSIIGNDGWHTQGKARAEYDQQPIEACCLFEAATEAHRLTCNEIWSLRMTSCANWFIGDNDQGLALFDPVSGGCYDGLMRDGVNKNQGAESLLAWLEVKGKSRVV